MNKKIVLLTGISWSWKTTLQNYMLENWWSRPINFTTRQPRSDEELDEYVFLTKKQFLTKFWNGDFLESTNYWWNFYWVSKTLPKQYKVCIILDPIWRSQVMELFNRQWIKYESYYLEISYEEQVRRLEARWDNEEQIVKRLKDNQWFHPTPFCTVIDWTVPVEDIYKIIN